jgi:hypothetical protein
MCCVSEFNNQKQARCKSEDLSLLRELCPQGRARGEGENPHQVRTGVDNCPFLWGGRRAPLGTCPRWQGWPEEGQPFLEAEPFQSRKGNTRQHRRPLIHLIDQILAGRDVYYVPPPITRALGSHPPDIKKILPMAVYF